MSDDKASNYVPKSERPSEVSFHVGQRLRAVRDALELSQEKLADSIGIRQNTYCNWETGSRLADPLAMIRLCDRYGVTMDWIYRGHMSGLPHDMAQTISTYFPRVIKPRSHPNRA